MAGLDPEWSEYFLTLALNKTILVLEHGEADPVRLEEKTKRELEREGVKDPMPFVKRVIIYLDSTNRLQRIRVNGEEYIGLYKEAREEVREVAYLII
jgi:hypothetical protein